jgi:hypothetical protein
MNNNNRVFTGNQPLRPQSDVLRSFTLVNIYSDESIVVAGSSEDLASVLASQQVLDDVIGLDVLVSRLWLGHVCVLPVCELVIIPDTHRISRFDLDYVEPFSMSSPVYISRVS